MKLEDHLLELILSRRNKKKIEDIAKELELNTDFVFSKNVEKLKGIWELRWSSSKSPLLNYSPLLDNLQILDPLNLNGLNLLKPKGIKAIIGTGIVAKLNPLNEKRLEVRFTHAGVIGPNIGGNKIKALAKVDKEQKGWLDITFLNNDLRVCRGDKGTLFVLRKIKDNALFEKFQKFIKQL